MKSNERFPSWKKSLEMQILEAASSAKKDKVMESQGAAQPNQLQQPLEDHGERSGAFGIGVCEVGSLVEGALTGRGPW